MEAFTIRDLRERTGELVRGAEPGQSRQLAGVSRSVFINHLAALKIPLARYGAEDLAQEVAAFA